MNYKIIIYIFSFFIGNFVIAQTSTFTVTAAGRSEICNKGKIDLFVSGGSPPYSFAWSNGLTTQNISNLEEGDYTVIITDAALNDTSIMYHVYKEVCPINIPYTFTPNGDGISDEWSIGNIKNFPDYQLQVFNRWGQIVHQQSGPDFTPWDGKQLGMNLPDATYFYILFLKKGENESKKGSVSIVR
jgi:gliding motility-associated-like protein